MSKSRIGIVGTGFIARQVYRTLVLSASDMAVTAILTRRPVDSVKDFGDGHITDSIAELLDHCDIVFEASGDAIHATVVVEHALRAGKRVLTMNSEMHVTTGSYFVGKGYLTESLGDQPGCSAALYQEAREMGFDVRAVVNIKGFLNPDPTQADMEYWAEKQKLAVDQTLSFTDGSKLQIEQVFVANGLGLEMATEGFVGGKFEKIEDCDHLVEASNDVGAAISDYVVVPSAPPGVFVVANHPLFESFADYGPFAKLSTTGNKGYILLRPFHLCALEVIRSLRAVANDAPILLDNGKAPRFGVAAVCKRPLKSGEKIKKALGTIDFRGRGVRLSDHPNHVPICLLADAELRRDLEPGQIATFEDVELPDSRALEIYKEIHA